MYCFWISHKNIGSLFIEKYPKTIATKIKSNGFTIYGVQRFSDDCSKRLLTLSTKNKLRMKIKTPTARVTSYSYSSYLRLVCVCLYVFNIIDIILIHDSSRSTSNLIATLGIDNQKDTLSKMLHNGRECVSAKIVSRLIFFLSIQLKSFTVFICSPHNQSLRFAKKESDNARIDF